MKRHVVGLLVVSLAAWLVACGDSTQPLPSYDAAADVSVAEDGAGALDGSHDVTAADVGPAYDAAPGCLPAATPGSSSHRAGQDCTSGCHSDWSIGGTVYRSASGGGGVSGATVRITGANSQVIDLVTGPEGNFHTAAQVSFPAQVEVSRCPDRALMSATISTGGCNASGCHPSGSRVHLP
jgi:hypothetical protein